MLGREALALQSFPWAKYPKEVLDKQKESFCADLVGNAFTGTVVLSTVDSLMQVVPWSAGTSSASEPSASSSASHAPGAAHVLEHLFSSYS